MCEKKKKLSILFAIWTLFVLILFLIGGFGEIKSKSWNIFFCIFTGISFLLFLFSTKVLLYDELKLEGEIKDKANNIYFLIVFYVFIGFLTIISYATNTKIQKIKKDLLVIFFILSLFILPYCLRVYVFIKKRFQHLSDLHLTDNFV